MDDGPFGRGDHYYLQGPWKKGVPEQGYQSRFSPAQLYRAAIKAIDEYSNKNFGGHKFADLSEDDRDKLLKGNDIDASQKAQLRGLIYQKRGEPRVKIEAKNPIDED